MKRLSIMRILSVLLLTVLLFSGCGRKKTVSVYGITDGIMVENLIDSEAISANGLVSMLAEKQVVPDGTMVTGFKNEMHNGTRQITLDLSTNFISDFYQKSDSQQRMAVQCIADTFIKSYSVDCVLLTCGGEPIEVSGSEFGTPITFSIINEPISIATPTATAEPTQVPTQEPTQNNGATPKPTDSSPKTTPVRTDGKKYIAITFDDGPSAEYTRKIVDKLKEHNATATFFVVGNRFNEKTIDAMKYAVDNGSEIQIHGYTHSVYYNSCSDAVYSDEMTKTHDAIKNAVGVAPTLMRPVGGSITKERIASSPYSIILWNIDSEDWKHKKDANCDTIVNNVMKDVGDGKIILMHEIYKNSYDAFCIIIDKLYAQGYEVVSVTNLFGKDNLKTGTRYYSAN